MGDLLVRLYDLPEFPSEAKVIAAGVTVRRALPPERHLVADWVRKHFSPYWVSEVEAAMSRLLVMVLKILLTLGCLCCAIWGA